jgi:nucleoside-diphosphate-sugar epimerase
MPQAADAKMNVEQSFIRSLLRNFCTVCMILVTGGTGFLGLRIVAALRARNDTVRVLVRPGHSKGEMLRQMGCEIAEGDVLDSPSLYDAMEGCEAVIHAAAIVSFRRAEHKLMRQTNVVGTANVVNAAMESDLQRLVHISSVAALHRQPGQLGNEDSLSFVRKGAPLYGYTKHLAEREVYRGVEEGLPAVILNPGVILGPASTANPADWQRGTPHLFRTTARGLRHYPLGGNAFVGVDDVARAAVLALRSEYSEGQRFILGADNWTYLRLFTAMAEALGVRPPTRRVSPGLAKAMGRVLERLVPHSPLTFESALNASSLYQYQLDRFLAAFPDFHYTPLDAVIQQTAAAFKQSEI